MSGEQTLGHFVEQAGAQIEENVNGPFGLGTFDYGDLDPDFDFYQFLEQPGGYSGNQDIFPADQPASDAVGVPTLPNEQGDFGETHLVQNTPTPSEPPAPEEVAADEPEKQDRQHVPTPKPSEVEFETYEENDPHIEKDPPRKEWGRTGRRNGQEVWFNPQTMEWRKYQFQPHANPVI